MIKRLLFLLLFASTAAAQQNQFPITVGFNPNYVEYGGTIDDTLNDATTYRAWGFNVSAAKTLSKVRFYCTSKTGTVANTDIHVALYSTSTSTGAPNSSLEDKTLAATPTCPGWNEWTGFTTALSASTQYFLVLRNANGTPASNYAVIHRVPKFDYSVVGGGRGGNGSGWGWNFRFSSDSGGTWSDGNGSGGHGGMRLEFSDATFAGIPVSSVDRDTTNEVYSSRENGAYFVIPSTWPTLKVAGISMVMNWQGTRPAQLRYRLYTGTSPSLAGTTQVADDEQLQIDTWVPLYFATPITVSPNQTIRVVAGAVSGGSAGNSYAIQKYTWDSDSNSRTLVPMSLQGSYYNGSSWTETTSNVVPFQLILDKAGEFSVPAGGGLKGHNQASGGSQ